MSIRHKIPNYNSTDSFFDKKRTIFSSFIKSEDSSIKVTGSGVLNLLFPTKKTVRGAKVSLFTSYVDGFYEVHADDTVDIKITVSVKGPTDQTGYTLSYLYDDVLLSSPTFTKRELLINPITGPKDYTLLEPVIHSVDVRILKSFKLEGMEVGDNTKLFIYVTLPLLNGHGNDYVATEHEIEIKKR